MLSLSPNSVRPTPKPISLELAGQLVAEGRRLMDHFQAFDVSSQDLNPAKGEVQVDIPSPLGINHACAKFSGDRYEGTLEINQDERQVYLDRKYEFNNSQGTVIITQQRPTFGNPRFDVYRIDEIHQQATVEYVR